MPAQSHGADIDSIPLSMSGDSTISPVSRISLLGSPRNQGPERAAMVESSPRNRYVNGSFWENNGSEVVEAQDNERVAKVITQSEIRENEEAQGLDERDIP